MPVTTKQQGALKDLQRSLRLSDDQWTAKFGDFSDDQFKELADGVLATPQFHKKLNQFNDDLAKKDLEVQQKKQELEANYTAEINRLGQIATTVQQTGGQDAHAVRAYQAKLNEIKTRYALDDAEVAVDVQTAQLNQQFQQPQQQFQQYQNPYQQQAHQPANAGYITQDELKRQIAESQTVAANNAANMVADTLRRNNEFFKEFGEPLDVDKVLTHANTYGVQIDAAINEVYDVPAKRAAKAKADEDARFNTRLVEERKTWEQSRATDGLFAPNSQAASQVGQKSVWDIKAPEAPPPSAGQVNVTDPARLADQASRVGAVLARLNS